MCVLYLNKIYYKLYFIKVQDMASFSLISVICSYVQVKNVLWQVLIDVKSRLTSRQS